MKVVHLITGLGMGGAERQLVALIQDKSNDHIVISLQNEGVMGQQIRDDGTPLYALNLNKNPISGFWHLIQILRHEKPDILQTWLYHADLIGLIAGKLTRVPRIIWSLRCSNMDLTQYRRLTAWTVRLLIPLSKYPDAVISNSHAGKAYHLALGYRPREWEVIPNGINMDVFCVRKDAGLGLRQELKIPPDALVIGMIARVDPMKDHETFIKAMQVVMSEREDVYCVLAGKGTDSRPWDLPSNRLRCLL